ncbi:MAG: hypothetical protein AB1598_00825 [Thermodesulfobacteriota bacterium]
MERALSTKGWIRKVVVTAGLLNVLALLTIVLSLVKFTPLTLIIAISVGGILMGAAILLYIAVVITDLRQRGVL